MYVPFDEFIGATGQGPIIARYQLSPNYMLIISEVKRNGLTANMKV
jgi:hypothetical protein